MDMNGIGCFGWLPYYRNRISRKKLQAAAGLLPKYMTALRRSEDPFVGILRTPRLRRKAAK